VTQVQHKVYRFVKRPKNYKLRKGTKCYDFQVANTALFCDEIDIIPVLIDLAAMEIQELKDSHSDKFYRKW